MRIKKLLIAGALVLTAVGCVSAYTIYANTLNKTANKEASTTQEQKTTTETKANAVKSTESTKDEELDDSKEVTDDSENEDVDTDNSEDSNDSTEDADESEDVTEPYEVVQDGNEDDITCDHEWGAEEGGYDSEKGYFYWRECKKCGQQKIDRYVSEEEYLKDDPDYQEPTTENHGNSTESTESTTEATTTEN